MIFKYSQFLNNAVAQTYAVLESNYYWRNKIQVKVKLKQLL